MSFCASYFGVIGHFEIKCRSPHFLFRQSGRFRLSFFKVSLVLSESDSLPVSFMDISDRPLLDFEFECLLYCESFFLCIGTNASHATVCSTTYLNFIQFFLRSFFVSSRSFSTFVFNFSLGLRRETICHVAILVLLEIKSSQFFVLKRVL